MWLGGNIKVSPLSYINKVKAHDIVVLELSSWLLENFREKKLAPHIAVVTNIYRDHLNTYKSMAEYVAAKKNIFACQKKSDFLIVNGENSVTKRWKKNLPQPLFLKEGGNVSNTPPFEKGRQGGILYFYKKDAKKYKTNLLGEHNLENIAAALAVAKIFKVSDATVKKVLRGFKGLSDRQELIAEIRGVKYINDTTATSPDGVIAALRTFGRQTPPNLPLSKGRKQKGMSPSLVKASGSVRQRALAILPARREGIGLPAEILGATKPKRSGGFSVVREAGAVDKNIILIAGGKDKELEYKELAKEIPKYCKAVVFFPGTATEKIKFQISNFKFQMAENMKNAVRQARAIAKKGDIVLLSPGAASFGLFKNEFDRGEQFRKAVAKISKN